MGLFDRKPTYPLSLSKKIDDELTAARMHAMYFNLEAKLSCNNREKQELASTALEILQDMPEDRFPNKNGTLYLYLLCLVRGCELVKGETSIDYSKRNKAAEMEQRVRSSYTFDFDANPKDLM